MELIKKWDDNSGDIFTVTYNPNGGEAIFSSAPNMSGEDREAFVKIVGTEETVGVKIYQSFSKESRKSYSSTIRCCEAGVVAKCAVFFDKKGTPCSIVIKRIYE